MKVVIIIFSFLLYFYALSQLHGLYSFGNRMIVSEGVGKKWMWPILKYHLSPYLARERITMTVPSR
jgi:hypothetical protein